MLSKDGRDLSLTVAFGEQIPHGLAGGVHGHQRPVAAWPIEHPSLAEGLSEGPGKGWRGCAVHCGASVRSRSFWVESTQNRET